MACRLLSDTGLPSGRPAGGGIRVAAEGRGGTRRRRQLLPERHRCHEARGEGACGAAKHCCLPLGRRSTTPFTPRSAPRFGRGRSTLDRAKRILDSPSRSRLAQRLLSGEVAVWILIKSGHDQKDRRALESLKTHLDRASATLRIPETGTDLNGNPVEVTDFKTYPVRFGLMEIARDDPDEDLLVSALLKSEPDLGRYDEPMAFPSLAGAAPFMRWSATGFRRRTYGRPAQSMLAWCSCEIKAQNPGTDLLISADWSRPFGGRMVKDPELPLTGLSGFLQDRKPAETAAPRRNPDPGSSREPCASWRRRRAAPPVRSTGAPAQAPAPGREPACAQRAVSGRGGRRGAPGPLRIPDREGKVNRAVFEPECEQL